MQSLIKYATAAALLVANTSALIARNAVNGTTTAAVAYTVDSLTTLNFQTYSNGEALSLIGFVNITG
jgi:hypothetical protein